MRDKEFRVITLRVDIDRWQEQEKAMTPGSTIDVCRVCEQSVWLSLDGARLAYEDHPNDSEVVCVECHISLEIERRKGDENAKPITPSMVPGAPSFPQVVQEMWMRDTEKQIKEGLEDGPTST